MNHLVPSPSQEAERWGDNPLAAMHEAHKVRSRRLVDGMPGPALVSEKRHQPFAISRPTVEDMGENYFMLVWFAIWIAREDNLRSAKGAMIGSYGLAHVITRRVAAAHEVTFADIVGPCRRRRIVDARFCAIDRVARATGWSKARLGRFFGGRDHTTILWALRKVAGEKRERSK